MNIKNKNNVFFNKSWIKQKMCCIKGELDTKIWLLEEKKINLNLRAKILKSRSLRLKKKMYPNRSIFKNYIKYLYLEYIHFLTEYKNHKRTKMNNYALLEEILSFDSWQFPVVNNNTKLLINPLISYYLEIQSRYKLRKQRIFLPDVPVLGALKKYVIPSYDLIVTPDFYKIKVK